MIKVQLSDPLDMLTLLVNPDMHHMKKRLEFEPYDYSVMDDQVSLCMGLQTSPQTKDDIT